MKEVPIHMKFSMTGQENVTFKYRCVLYRGDRMGKFDCIYSFNNRLKYNTNRKIHIVGFFRNRLIIAYTNIFSLDIPKFYSSKGYGL